MVPHAGDGGGCCTTGKISVPQTSVQSAYALLQVWIHSSSAWMSRIMPINPSQVSPELCIVALTLHFLSWKCFVPYLEIYLRFFMTVLWASGKLVLSFLLPAGCFESLQRLMDFCLFSNYFYSFLLLQKSKSVDPFCAISQSSSPLMMSASLQHPQNLFVPAQTAAGFSLGLGVSCQQTPLSFLDPALVCNHFQFNERFLILYWILDRPQLPTFNCL